jgi:hypothetical protein
MATVSATPTATPIKSHLFTYTDGSSLWQVSARWLANIQVWEGNRVMDEAHLAALTAAITDPRQIQGPFSIVEYTAEDGSRQRKIVDGQHRQAVLAQYFATTAEEGDEATDFSVLVRRYTVADHAAVVTIFQQINYAKPMEYHGSPTERIHDIVRAMTREFIGERAKGGLVALVRSGCNRPALSTEHLETALKAYRIHERADLTPAAIVEHARKMNGLYAEDTARIPVASVTASIIIKADEYGFYLGLDPKCAWLAGLCI